MKQPPIILFLGSQEAKNKKAHWHIQGTLDCGLLLAVGYTGKIFKILSSKFFWVGKYVSRQKMTKKAPPGQIKKCARAFSEDYQTYKFK